MNDQPGTSTARRDSEESVRRRDTRQVILRDVRRVAVDVVLVYAGGAAGATMGAFQRELEGCLLDIHKSVVYH